MGSCYSLRQLKQTAMEGSLKEIISLKKFLNQIYMSAIKKGEDYSCDKLYVFDH